MVLSALNFFQAIIFTVNPATYGRKGSPKITEKIHLAGNQICQPHQNFFHCVTLVSLVIVVSVRGKRLLLVKIRYRRTTIHSAVAVVQEGNYGGRDSCKLTTKNLCNKKLFVL